MPKLNNSIFREITLSDIDYLIAEHNLIKAGYKVVFIIDPDDIVNYCYPFGLSGTDDSRKDKPIEIATDEQIAYYYFFENNTNFVILDEYLDELKGFQNKIIYRKHLGLKIVDSFNILLEKYKKYKNENNFSFEVFKDLNSISEYQISIFLSVSIGSLRHGIQKFNKLESDKKLIITTDDLFDSNFSSIVKEIINNNKPSNLAQELFQIARAFSSDKTEKQLSNKLALLRDCNTIDRITSFNNKARERNQKIIFSFLSSTKKSKRIYELIPEKLLIDFKEIMYNPLKSINQLFIQQICLDNHVDKTISNLEELREFIQSKQEKETNSNQQYITEKNYRSFESRVVTARKKFENTSLLLRYDSNKIEQSLLQNKANNPKWFHEVFNIIENVSKLVEYSEEIEQIKETSINKISYESDFINTLIEGIKKIEKGANIFVISKGLDYVSGLYNHFPIVYFINAQFSKEIISEIVRFYLSGKSNLKSSQQLIKLINDTFSLVFNKNITNEDEKIIRLLIFLMLPVSKTDNIPERKAFERAENILKSESIQANYLPEFYYITSWIARRIQKYEVSLSYAEKGLLLDNNDPRFYHSKALSNYCLYMDNNKNINFLDKAIADCFLAKEKYDKLSIDNNAIQKSTIAVLNIEAYLLCLKFIHSNNESYLQKAYRSLEIMKHKESNFNQFPEFLHTESLILFQKYLFEKEPTFKDISLQSIINAIKLNPKQSYKDLQKKIETTK